MPTGLIDQQHGMSTRRDGFGDLFEMQVHRLGIAGRQNQGRALALFRADGAEDVCRGGALIAGSARAGATSSPFRIASEPSGRIVELVCRLIYA